MQRQRTGLALFGWQNHSSATTKASPHCAVISSLISERSHDTEAVVKHLFAQIPPHSGRTSIVIREDLRYEIVASPKKLAEYLRTRGRPPRIRVFPSRQGQIDVIDFVPGGWSP